MKLKTRYQPDCTPSKGKVEYQEFSPANVKPLLDSVDKLLARVIGLSEIDLDFLVNFDVKFRVSGDD